MQTLAEFAITTKNTETLLRFIKDMPVGEQVPFFVSQLFSAYTNSDEGTQKVIKILLKEVELRYPVELDKGLFLTLNDLPTEQHSLLLQFVQMTFGDKHTIMKDTNTTLFLSLEHPSNSVRLVALDKLKQIATEYENVDNVPPSVCISALERQPIVFNLFMQTKQFFTDSLTRLLSDENVAVLEKLLQFPNLIDFVGAEVIAAKIIKLLKTVHQEESSESIFSTIISGLLQPKVLKTTSQSTLDNIIPLLFEFLWVTKKV